MTVKVVKKYRGGCRLLLECPDEGSRLTGKAVGDDHQKEEDPVKPKPVPPELDIDWDDKIITPMPEPKPKFSVPTPTPDVVVVPEILPEVDDSFVNTMDEITPIVPYVEEVTDPDPMPELDPVVDITPEPDYSDYSESHVPALIPTGVIEVVPAASKAISSVKSDISRGWGEIVNTPTAQVHPAGGGSGTVTVQNVDVTPTVTKTETSAKKAIKVGRVSNAASIGLDALGYIADNVEDLSNLQQVAEGLLGYVTSIPQAVADVASKAWDYIQLGDLIGLGTHIVDSISPAPSVARVLNRVSKELGGTADIPTSIQEDIERSKSSTDPFNWMRYSGH